MVQWVKELAGKPDDLISIPGTHMMEGKNTHTHRDIHIPPLPR